HAMRRRVRRTGYTLGKTSPFPDTWPGLPDNAGVLELVQNPVADLRADPEQARAILSVGREPGPPENLVYHALDECRPRLHRSSVLHRRPSTITGIRIRQWPARSSCS